MYFYISCKVPVNHHLTYRLRQAQPEGFQACLEVAQLYKIIEFLQPLGSYLLHELTKLSCLLLDHCPDPFYGVHVKAGRACISHFGRMLGSFRSIKLVNFEFNWRVE